MALLGPMVVVAETPATDLVDVFGKAGAFPVVEARWSDAPAAIAEIQPVALATADPESRASGRHLRALAQCIETRAGPITPVIALVEKDATTALPNALPITLDDSTDRLIARLCSALRIRTLHACVLARARSAGATKGIPACVPPDMLDHASMLCIGRGGSYHALSRAVGERLSLIGASSVETAMRHLDARDVDGVIIGEGLGPHAVETLLSVLAEEARFRDLPVGVLDNASVSDERLPNLLRIAGDPMRLVAFVLPFVRLQAFAGQLKRVLNSLESEGAIDGQTGLLGPSAFWQDLERAVRKAEQAGDALSLARFSFDGITDRRTYLDAARLFGRLLRNIDFACGEADGSILAAFAETDLRSAHVLARRIAGMLRRTMLSLGRGPRIIKPTITLATLKPTDDLGTLLGRVGSNIAADRQIAAERRPA